MEEATEEQVLLVIRGICNYWKTPKPFSASHYRGLVMGLEMSYIMTQLTVYKLLQRSVGAGDVPYWTTDMFIILASLITVLTTPYLSWLGFQRRRRTMQVWGLVAFFVILLVSFTSYKQNTDTDFCQSRKTTLPKQNKPSIAHLILPLVIMVAATIAGNASWCHGVAYIDENAPETTSEYGILVCVKVLTYSTMLALFGHLIETDRLWIQMLLLNLGYVINLPQLSKVPQELDMTVYKDRGYFTSVGRVVRNKLVMSQIVSMALLMAGFWGSAYYRKDILQSKYLFVEPNSNVMYTYTKIIYYHFLILAVFFFGMKYSKPLMPTFNKHAALKTLTFLAASLFGMYIAISFFDCKKGPVAGLSAKEFVWPLCSRDCSCSHQVELNPVCVYDEMVTYLSPCHAGCTGMENLHGFSVMSNCTCAGGKRAAVGACAQSVCSTMLSLHAAVWLFVIIFFSLAVMLQLVSILRSVDVRDKSVALGVALTVVAALAFVAGHIAYTAVSYHTCAWSDEGVCKLHSSKFPNITYFMSAAFSLLSTILTFITFLLVKKSESSPKAPLPESSVVDGRPRAE